MARAPKFFKVEYIPEARGRRAVKDFAVIVQHYASSKGLRLGDMCIRYGDDGETIHLTLHTSIPLFTDGRPPEPDCGTQN